MRWALSAPLEGEGARFPVIAVDDDARWIAAWEIATGTTTRVLVAEEEDGGNVAIREPAASLGGSAGAPDVAARDGAIVVLQQRGSADDGVIVASARDDDGDWHDPHTRADALSFAPHAYEPRAAVVAGDERLVVWNQWRGDGYGVEVASLDASGNVLARPIDANDVLSPHVFYSNAPRIALVDDGAALIAWYQSLGGPLRVLVSERSGVGQPFSRPSASDALSSEALPVDDSGSCAPFPAVDHAGRAAIVWGEERDGAIELQLALRAAGDASWTIVEIASGSIGGARVVCASDAAAVVWAEADLDEPARIHLALVSDEGAIIERVLGDGGARAFGPAIAASRTGELAVAWSENGDAGASIHVVAIDGAPLLERSGAYGPALAWDAAGTTLAAIWIEDGNARVATLR